MIEQLQTKIKT